MFPLQNAATKNPKNLRWRTARRVRGHVMRLIFLDIDGVLVTRRPCVMEEMLGARTDLMAMVA